MRRNFTGAGARGVVGLGVRLAQGSYPKTCLHQFHHPTLHTFVSRSTTITLDMPTSDTATPLRKTCSHSSPILPHPSHPFQVDHHHARHADLRRGAVPEDQDRRHDRAGLLQPRGVGWGSGLRV